MRSLECLEHTAEDYLSVYRAGEIDLPIDEIKALIVDIVAHHPNVVAIAIDPKHATDAIWAIDPATVPPGVPVGLITGIINPALGYVRGLCPETEARELPGPEGSHLLEWPSADAGE